MNTSMIFRLTFIFSIFYTNSTFSQDTAALKTQEIEAVSVSFKKEEMVFEDSKSFILDFYIGEERKVLLLKQLNKYRLVLLNDHMKVVTSLTLSIKPNRLYEDCMGALFLITKDDMRQLNTDDGTIAFLGRPISLEESVLYNDCVASNSHHFLFRDFSSYGKEVTFTSLVKTSNEELVVYEVGDSLQIIDVNLEAEYIEERAYNPEDRMKEISDLQLLNMRDEAERVFYFQTMLEGEEYHPLFMQNDTTYIFDHVNDWVVRIDSLGNLIDSIPIVHHLNEEWGEELLQDKGRSNFYASKIDGAKRKYILLDQTTFLPRKEIDLEKNQVLKKVMVFNGYAYYAVRPNYQSNLNKLYRQRL